MTKKLDNLSTSTLLVKNLPKDVETLTEMLAQLRPLPSGIKPFGRRRALLYYEDEAAAQQGLQQLHGLKVQERQVTASLFFKEVVADREAELKASISTAEPAGERKNKPSKGTQTSLKIMGASAMPAISNYVRQLYACNADLDFEQPPPPYLRYAYPAITPAILDSICIVLMSNTRFYTQVLHLMNRMNLEPPFGPRTQKFVPPGEPCDRGTQTEQEVSVINEALLSTQPAQTSSEESELETSGDELDKRQRVTTQVKRKQPSMEAQYKKKARLLLQSSLLKKSLPPTEKFNASAAAASSQALKEMFEQPAEVKPSKIAVNIFKAKLAKAPVAAALPVQPAYEPPADLATTRLTLEQLKLLPIYKNYTQGEPSPKLYIKNLAKDVSVEDLQALYARFAPTAQMEIKVMHQGRMKGQAFVTFHNIAESALDTVVGAALRETNGFVLKQKPMVVCFGRK